MFLFLLGTISGVGTLTADDSTCAHDVKLVITPIQLVTVENTWRLASVEEKTSGQSRTTLTTTYGITCNVDNTVLRATLVDVLPQGASIGMRMQSNIGTSRGWVSLAARMPTVLVTDAKGVEYNHVQIEIRAPKGVSMSSIPIGIAYTIDEI